MSKGIDNKVRKPVSFNRTKEHDIKMLRFLGRRNFSGYVKKLIQEDMLRQKKEELSTGVEVPEKDSATEGISIEGKSFKQVETVEERLVRLAKELQGN